MRVLLQVFRHSGQPAVTKQRLRQERVMSAPLVRREVTLHLKLQSVILNSHTEQCGYGIVRL